jgi:hypothetical protein
MHAAWMIALLLTGEAADKPAVPPPARVRAADNARRVLADATAQSRTIRDLCDRLDASDVIVYVEMTGSPQVPIARTKLVTSTAAARFLRIAISNTTSPFDVAPLLAHELQHAVEIAEHEEVRDDAGLRRLYAAIGREAAADEFETDAARQVERTVRAESRTARILTSARRTNRD